MADKAKKKIDCYQKEAIESKINTVVSAGAGSGKTTVLSERFSDLVLNRGCEVDEILTLTFTKKATVEMSSRIYKVLKEKNKEKAKDFYKANIKTIDSYCSSLAKTGAHYYGISPDFSENGDAIKEKINSLALPFILKHRDNEAVKALVNTKNYQDIASQLFVDSILDNSTVVSPIDFDAELEKQKEAVIEVWQKESDKAQHLVADLERAVDAYGGKASVFMTALKEAMSSLELPEAPVITLEMINASDCEKLKEFCRPLIKLNSVKRNYGGAKNIDEIKAVLKEIKEVNSPVLFSLINFIEGIPVTKAIIPLLKEFQNTINDLKRQTGMLSFSDISDIALKTLIEHPEIRQIEKKKYKAIMIDEFQDNNQVQKDMLFMLAEKPERMEKGVPGVEDLCPDKLFFVGDEKQSIYRFRGADVSVFRALSEDFKDGNLSMSTNYRSSPALIAAFNTIFGGIKYPCREQDDVADRKPVFFLETDLSYEAVYKEVTLSKDAQEEVKDKEKSKEIYKPHVHIARYDSDQNAQGKQIVEEEAEAEWVAQKILQLTSTGVNGKKYRPEEIAILFRTNALQSVYERILLNNGIPYDTETVTGLFADGPVNDIFSMLKLCVYENDSMAYAQILRSPFVNLSAEETNAILITSTEPFCEQVEQILDEQSLIRFRSAKQLFEETKLYIKNEPLTKIITRLWYETGYRYETMWNKKVSVYQKMYDLVFELARQAEQDNVSLSAFIDNTLAYKDEKLDGMDIPVEQNSGVHIMSIHKSKGLEFNVVFVCGTHKKGRNEYNSEPIYYSKEYGFTVNTPAVEIIPGTKVKSNYFFNVNKELESNKATAELRRLTYVALTRAIDELYITNGKYSVPKEGFAEYAPGASKNPGTIYNVLAPVIEYYENTGTGEQLPFDFEEIPAYERRTYSSEGNLRNTQQEKVSLLAKLNIDADYQNAPVIQKEQIEPKYATPSQLHSPDEETRTDGGEIVEVQNVPYRRINEIIMATIPKWNKEVSAEQPKPKFDFTHFGTIAHAYMEAAVKQEEVRISNRDIVGLENSSEKLEEIKQICLEMQQKFIQCELGQKAVNSKWHKAEYSFRSKVASKIIKGIIDLVFENDDGSYTVVDYKTNQEMKPEVYYNQLACYRQAVSQMLNVEPQKVYCSLYYLRFGKAVDITQECSMVDVEKIVDEQSFMANT